MTQGSSTCGDNVTVKIISVDDEKYSLSIKALEKKSMARGGREI